MKNTLKVMLLLLPSIAAASSGHESAAVAAQGSFVASVGDLVRLAQSVRTPAFSRPHDSRAIGLTRVCSQPLVHINRWNEIYADGKQLGTMAATFKSACGAMTVWTDTIGGIYKNERQLGSACARYEISPYTGTAAWINEAGELHRDEVRLGAGAVQWHIASYTGDVVWLNSWGELYWNERLLGVNVAHFDMTADGRVQWRDSGDVWHYSPQPSSR